MTGSRQEFIDGDWYVGDHDGTPIEAGDDGTWLDVTIDDLARYGFLPADCCDEDGEILGADPDVWDQAFTDAFCDALDPCRVTDSDDKRYVYRIELL